MKKYTLEQIRKKYNDKYIDISKSYNYKTREDVYEVRKVYSEIHENTTLGQDVGTDMEYRR